MQEKVLDRVEAMIEANGLEVQLRPRWANTGSILAVRNDFNVEFNFEYGFYDGYHDASLSGPAVDRLIEEYGIQTQTSPRTRVTIEYVDVAGVGVRIQDCTGERGIALPFEMRKRYLKWYRVEYGDETRAMLDTVGEVAAYAARVTT